MKSHVFIGLACLVVTGSGLCQTIDTSAHIDVQNFSNGPARAVYIKKPFPARSFILPSLAIAYGSMALENKELKNVNSELQEEIWQEGPQRHTTLDNYLQWTPVAMVYGLNMVGIHGKNNLRDRTIIYALSQVFMNAIVFPLKRSTHEYRPDGSDSYSFPSGHTATAFLGAEFMWREYKEVSPWLAASGYLPAGATGFLRMYNNKHWLSDIVAGAGIGMASTELAYWLYPKIEHKFFKKAPPNTY